jgi:hypothetical protein
MSSDADEFKRVAAKIINSTTKSARSSTTAPLGTQQLIQQEINVDDKGLAPFLSILEKATQENLESGVRVEGGRQSNRRTGRLDLSYFKPIQTAVGVSIIIYKRRGITQIRSAFGPNIPRLGHNVFKRKGKARLPIRKLPGVSVASVYLRANLLERQAADGMTHMKKQVSLYIKARNRRIKETFK